MPLVPNLSSSSTVQEKRSPKPQVRPSADVQSQAQPSFSIRSRTEIAVSRWQRATLSIPALDRGETRLNAKDLMSAGPAETGGKFTLEEHLQGALDRGRIMPRVPLLALGLRNNLVNPRAIVQTMGSILAAENEDPARSRRPYYGLLYSGGRFQMVKRSKFDDRPTGGDFFCSGIPVLWDDLGGEALFERILVEAADHSHVFDLPRGNHPLASDASREAWQALHEAFLATLHEEVGVAVRAMRAALAACPQALKRCDTYLHSLLGVDRQGSLVNVVAYGRLEDLGHLAAARGCRRAVCVENSGSVMPTYLPEGWPGPIVPLMRAPNFRPKGRVVLLIELADDSFGELSPAPV
jgi:hypothetical protein